MIDVEYRLHEYSKDVDYVREYIDAKQSVTG